MERDQIADMVAAAEARSETKLERALGELRGDIKALDTKVSALPGRWTVFGAALTAVGIILAALAFGNDMFSRGFTSHDVAASAAQQAVALMKK